MKGSLIERYTCNMAQAKDGLYICFLFLFSSKPFNFFGLSLSTHNNNNNTCISWREIFPRQISFSYVFERIIYIYTYVCDIYINDVQCILSITFITSMHLSFFFFFNTIVIVPRKRAYTSVYNACECACVCVCVCIVRARK